MSNDPNLVPPELLEIADARNLLEDLKKHIISGKSSQELSVPKFTSMMSRLRKNMTYLNDGLVPGTDTTGSALPSRERVQEQQARADGVAVAYQVEQSKHASVLRTEADVRRECPLTHTELLEQLGVDEVLPPGGHKGVLNTMRTEKVEREVQTEQLSGLKRRRDELVEQVDSSRAALQRGKHVVGKVLQVQQESERSLSTGVPLRRKLQDTTLSEQLQRLWGNTLQFSKVGRRNCGSNIINWNGFDLVVEDSTLEINLDGVTLLCSQQRKGPMFVTVSTGALDHDALLFALNASSGWTEAANSLGLLGEEPAAVCPLGVFLPSLLDNNFLNILRKAIFTQFSAQVIAQSVGTVRLREYFQDTSDWSSDALRQCVLHSADDRILQEQYILQRRECVVEDSDVFTVKPKDNEVNRFELLAEDGTLLLDVTLGAQEEVITHHGLCGRVPAGVLTLPGCNIFAELWVSGKLINM